MEENEAKTIIKILETADGSCSYCVKNLIDIFRRSFPKWKHLPYIIDGEEATEEDE